MNKLFYLILMFLVAIVGCSSDQTDSGKRLDRLDATSEVDSNSVHTLTFLSKDSLEITADYYPNKEAEHLIVLCHQADFSRGEYVEIAQRLVDSGYACLAVDLRSGGTIKGVVNETHQRAIEQGKPFGYLDARKDIEAAIDFVAANSSKDVYLWGSSYSASLAMMIAAKDARIKRVIAFSPGEYFGNQSTVRSAIIELTKPLFITSSKAEYKLIVAPLIAVLPKHNVVAFQPSISGDHGSKMLWSAAGDETYAELFKFL